MTAVAHPAAHRRSPSPPAASRNTSAMSPQRRQPSFDRPNAALPRIVAIENDRRRSFRRQHRAPLIGDASLAHHPRP